MTAPIHMENSIQPIYIMSSERSGSNLLRAMLGSHSLISAPPPLHLYNRLSLLMPYYGSLIYKSNFERLASDAIRLSQVEGPLQWQYDVTIDEVVSKVHSYNLPSLLGTMYSNYANREGNNIWVCKDNNIFDYAFDLIYAMSNAKFIYLCRDGRDVACSAKKKPLHDQHMYFIAKKWEREQKSALKVYQNLVYNEQCMVIRYEDLVNSPEAEMRELCTFIGVEFEETMTEFYLKPEVQEEAHRTIYWENLKRPIMSNNTGKYINELTRKELNIFESVAFNSLKILGYDPFYEQNKKGFSFPQKALFYFQNRLKSYMRKAHFPYGEQEEREAMNREVKDIQKERFSYYESLLNNK